MKTVITLIALVLLSGCGTYKSLEQLEREAMLTGDWSAVELRERQLARRNPTKLIQCPAGKIGVCDTSFGQATCNCVDREMLGFVLGN